MTVEQFKKSNKTKKESKLLKFKDEILELERERYSQNSIVEFLAMQGVKTTQSAISMFLYAIKKEEIEEPKVRTSTAKKKDLKSNNKKSNNKKESFSSLLNLEGTPKKPDDDIEPDYSKYTY